MHFFAPLLAAAALACGRVPAVAPPPGPPAEQVPGATEWRDPRTLDEAASMIRRRLRDIRKCLDSSAVAAVHSDAWDVVRLARALPDLADKEADALPVGGVSAVKAAAEELAGAADRLHTLADAENVGEARPRLEEVASRFAAVEALVPARFVCPMRCDNGKIYGAPGDCPVCKMALKKITGDTYQVSVVPEGPLEAGKPAVLRFTIADPTGARAPRLDVVHQKLLHLLVVSQDLSWFAHEHPDLQPDSSFALQMTFPSPGTYTLFNDFTPTRAGMQVVPVEITVPGEAPAPKPLYVEPRRSRRIGDLTVTLTIPEPITTGAPTKFRYLVMEGNVPVTDLDLFLGELGHLIIVKDDRSEFVHSHPGGRGHHGTPQRGPTVLFEAYFKVPGRYKSWAQFQRAGRVITVPFTFDVKPGKVHAEGGAPE